MRRQFDHGDCNKKRGCSFQLPQVAPETFSGAERAVRKLPDFLGESAASSGDLGRLGRVLAVVEGAEGD